VNRKGCTAANPTAVVLIRQGNSARKEEWCAVQELKWQRTERKRDPHVYVRITRELFLENISAVEQNLGERTL
jgi:hypothetical protein